MHVAPSHTVIYEQPLNERIRAFMRFEHLFKRAEYQLQVHDDELWASRAILETLNSLIALANRPDLKSELIQELRRHEVTLEALEQNPRVDLNRLHELLHRIKLLLEKLRTSENIPGNDLKGNEFLAAIRQRSNAPAGACPFDLPGFHFWLQSPADERFAQLAAWLSSFDVVRDTVSLCLTMVRESAVATRETATGGFFQKDLEKGSPCQMVRVALPASAPWYPEISAGRHRFTLRFMVQPKDQGRPAQTEEGVEFDLLCCVI